MSYLILVRAAEFADRIADEIVHGLEPLFIQSSKRKAKPADAQQPEELSVQSEEQVMERLSSHEGFDIKI